MSIFSAFSSLCFVMDFLSAGFGDMMYYLFKSIYHFQSADLGIYYWIIFFLFVFTLSATVIFLIYITFKTLIMKKDTAMMSVVLGQEGEVIEVLGSEGNQGWALVHGENWKFKSEQPVKVGDTIKVIRHKKMNLVVEKVKGDF